MNSGATSSIRLPTDFNLGYDLLNDQIKITQKKLCENLRRTPRESVVNPEKIEVVQEMEGSSLLLTTEYHRLMHTFSQNC